MAAVCPINLDRERLKAEVRATYAQVAQNPEGDFHFHRGPKYAAEFLGYDLNELRATRLRRPGLVPAGSAAKPPARAPLRGE